MTTAQHALAQATLAKADQLPNRTLRAMWRHTLACYIGFAALIEYDPTLSVKVAEYEELLRAFTGLHE